MKILDAMEIIDCDFEHVDFEVLVGALLQLKRWDEHYGELRKKGKRSMFDAFRLDGEKAIKSYREEMERDEVDDSDRLILKIFQRDDGLWFGRLFAGDVEFGQCGAYASVDEVSDAAAQSGIMCDLIEIWPKKA